jgi:hypothetical protein
MKKIFFILHLVIWAVVIVSSCHKECSNPVTTTKIGCPDMYNSQSRPYTNPYMGTLETFSPIPPYHVYPDRFVYKDPCINPNNEYEFCYLRRENSMQFDDDQDLYVFNFCSGKTNLITRHVAYSPDWSVKDWIIFTGQDRNLWKVKSNGDSLTQLTFSVFCQNAKWNSNGTMFGYNYTNIANEKGELIYTTPRINIIGWYDSINLLGYKTFDSTVTKMNITNGFTNFYAPNYGYGYVSYNKNSDEFLGNDYYPNLKISQGLTYKVVPKVLKYLPTKCTQSFIQNIRFICTKKLLLQQILKDTMTGSIERINYRSHIAIMDLDGTNLRQVMIPE